MSILKQSTGRAHDLGVTNLEGLRLENFQCLDTWQEIWAHNFLAPLIWILD